MNYYVGHPLQVRGAEQYVLKGGKGDGMNFLYARNGLGLEIWISADRCADVARVTFNGKNMSYTSPCGQVAPAYYDRTGLNFLKSFNAGFFTTCGFDGAGGPCVDEGEEIGLHGRIGNTPATLDAINESEEELKITFTVRDHVIFGRKFTLKRTYIVSYTENSFSVNDSVTNYGDNSDPFCLLYHCNMGYPLLSENSIVHFPNTKIWANDENAVSHIDTALVMEKPQANYAERCYFFDAKEKDGKVNVGIYNPDISAGLVMSYDKKELPCLTEWKMMGKYDYVLGIEPGNVCPCPRNKMRENGVLPFLGSEETYNSKITFSFTDKLDNFESRF
ncbi:MAG: DUF4432 family protein [Ruminococcaceae bacterium]|nr:DUF4432 family protein [Oscillospiraceae bacterium]